MPHKKILIPLPNRDFDPTEVCISWKIIQDSGHEVVFATENGERAHCDPLMISGEGLDFWGFIPLLKKLKLVGNILRAQKDARDAYFAVEQDMAFLNPLRFDAVQTEDYDGIILPGGHAKGMRQYLESKILQNIIVDFFEKKTALDEHRPVGAVCHGVLVVARSISGKTGRSVLYGRKTTALTWAQESAAEKLSRVVRFWDPLYYRTYSESAEEPEGYWSVESEVKRAMESEDDFLAVPVDALDYKIKTNNISRDTKGDARAAWVVQDGNYVSARWPGDAHSFAQTFTELLNS